MFDVSTIPHTTIDFTDTAKAIATVRDELTARIREQKFHQDARIQLAVASLSSEELILLQQMREYSVDTVWGREVKGLANWYGIATGRLLDKGLIRLAGEFEDNKPAFAFTPLGYVVHQVINKGLRQFKDPSKPEEESEAAADAPATS